MVAGEGDELAAGVSPRELGSGCGYSGAVLGKLYHIVPGNISQETFRHFHFDVSRALKVHAFLKLRTYALQHRFVRMTVDEQRDLDLITELVTQLGTGASMEAYAGFLQTHPGVRSINSDIQRNEGYQKSLDNDQ